MSPGGGVQLRAGVATDTGRVRPINQDSYMVLPDRGLWVVADGMGGAQAGEVASSMAIEALRDSYVDPTIESLAAAMAEANRRIHDAARDPDLQGMGTTAVAIALVPGEPDPDDPGAEDEQHLLVVNVGDSRAYLFRDAGLTQLTDDHSVVAQLVRDGRISQAEADAHPQRNIVTRVLGPYPDVQVDIWPVDPVRGDRYLLCSDGLFNEVPDDQMAAVLRRLEDPSDAAAELVRLANESGGRDNITVIVLDVVDDGGRAEKASRAIKGDLAGFSTALDADRLSDEQLDGVRSAPSRASRRAERKAARSTRSRVTWRAVLFALLVLAVVGGAFATIQWYGTSTYYVGFEGDEVTIFKGRPGGLLCIDPELEDGTGILRDEVPARYLDDVDAGHEVPSLARANQYVSNIERDIAATATTTTTTTPTTAPVTTSTAPAP
jgi:serine/threonine protein phosphatase PrpC